MEQDYMWRGPQWPVVLCDNDPTLALRQCPQCGGLWRQDVTMDREAQPSIKLQAVYHEGPTCEYCLSAANWVDVDRYGDLRTRAAYWPVFGDFPAPTPCGACAAQRQRKQAFYLVWCPQKSPPAMVHPSLEEAAAEAARLAEKHPGQAFYVLRTEAVSFTSTPKPVTHRAQNNEARSSIGRASDF